jgi:hypothetical protein
MEICSVLLFGKCGRLLQSTAMEAGLKHFKEKFGPENFGADLHPGLAFFALGEIPAVGGNPGHWHCLSSFIELPIKALIRLSPFHLKHKGRFPPVPFF